MADDARDEIRILLHQLGDDAAGEPLQDDMAAAARPELRDLGDDADAAQLVFLRLRFRIGDPLRLAIDPAVRGHFADGVGQQGSQLTLLVRDAIRRAGFGFGKDRAFSQDQDVPVFATRGALDDPGRFFVLDRERNRHVRQKERLIDNENRQEHVRWFPRGPFLGTTTTGGARLGRGHCRLRAVRGRSPLGAIVRHRWRRTFGTR